MERILATFILGAVTTHVGASDLNEIEPVRDMLEISTTRNLASVEFCPDNACTKFALRGPGANRPLHDFVLAYLFSVSTDPVLSEFQADGALPQIRSLIERYRFQCPHPQAKAATRCVVSYLARNNDIRAYSVRYDEGRWESPVPLSNYIGGT